MVVVEVAGNLFEESCYAGEEVDGVGVAAFFGHCVVVLKEVRWWWR
jgi:hypothetical protein